MKTGWWIIKVETALCFRKVWVKLNELHYISCF